MRLLQKLQANNLAKNIVGAYLVKGCSVVIGVLLVRVYMQFFSNIAILGVWYTILSLISWFINCDLGITQGLRNLSARAIAKDDKIGLRTVVSSGYVTISFVSVVLTIVCGIVALTLDWNSYFGISVDYLSAPILKISVFISLLGIVLQMVSKLITSLLNAMEKTVISNILTLSTNIILVLFVAIYKGNNDQNSILLLSIVYFFACNVPYFVVSYKLFSGRLREAKPSIKYARMDVSKEIMSLSGRFFVVQIFLMVVTVTNELFITSLIGVTEVVNYQVYHKLYNTILLFFSLATNPIWSSMTKNWQKRDMGAFKKNWKWLKYGMVLFVAGTVLMSLLLEIIVGIWLGDEAIVVSYHTVFVFALYTVIMIVAYAFAAIANSISALGTQMVCYGLGALAKYPLCLFALHIYPDWSSIILVNAIIMLFYIMVEPIVLRYRISKQQKMIGEVQQAAPIE